MIRSKNLDLLVILAFVAFSTWLTLHFQVRALVSALLYFLLPSIYLLIRRKLPLQRIVVGALFLGLLVSFSVDFLLSFNNAWNENFHQLVFPYKLFGFLPIDEPIWFFIWALEIIVFYEYFFEREKTSKISKNFRRGLTIFFTILFIILFLFKFFPSSIQFDYIYAIIGSLIVIPIVYVVHKNPKLIVKFLKAELFFFFLYLIHELAAVHTRQWNFEGSYIGSITLFSITFPFEELFFWMLLSSSSILSLYEIFVDDTK